MAQSQMTLMEVARQAKVSISTVSMVMNGHAGKYRISKETISKVELIAGKLNYRPSGSARALIHGRTNCVGLFMPNMAETMAFEIYASMFTAMNSKFHEYDFNTMVFELEQGKETIPRMIRERYVDGIIMAHSSPEYIIDELKRLCVPSVFVNVSLSAPYDSIVPDDYQGMRLAVKHMVDLGHRRILYLNKHSMEFHPSMSTRLRAFYETMQECGLVPYAGSDTLLWRKRDDKPQPPNAEDFKVFLTKILARPAENRPTAVIAYTALWLRELMLTIQHAGLRVPQDISVICCDQMQMVREWVPRITHVRIDGVAMGSRAADMLYNKIEGKISKPIPAILIPEELVVLESTMSPSK